MRQLQQAPMRVPPGVRVSKLSETVERLILIETPEQIQELREYLKAFEFIAYDTETTGLDKSDEIIGVCIAAEVNVGYYIVLSHWDVAQQKLVYRDTKEATRALIGDLALDYAVNGRRRLIMHNAPFDCAMTLNNFGIELMQSVHTDTLPLAHLLDENRHPGLKELGVSIFGEDAKQEQTEMKASVTKNGGMLTKENYELYKGDAHLIGRYGAKDAILTLKLFFHLVPELFDQGLDKFFYEDETMPLLRGPTYDLNTTGLCVDPEKLLNLKGSLEAEIMEAKAFVDKEIRPHYSKKYTGKSKAKTFNVGSGKQLAWLLFFAMENDYVQLTDEGRGVCHFLDIRLPYSPGDRRAFIREVIENKGKVWRKAGYYNPKTKKTLKKDKKLGEPWNYIASGKKTLQHLAPRYKWVAKLLELRSAEKLLSTYVIGIRDRAKYNVIRPGFKQHGTTSGRYSSNNPNFQNLPRDDKRVKACIVARKGKCFVGADYSQLEPRVFASFSKDERLLECFRSGLDFYSVIGVELSGIKGCSLNKKDKNFFGDLQKPWRQKSKVVALAATYGKTAHSLAPDMGISISDADDIIDSYFTKFPSVKKLMLESHEMAKRDGQVVNLFGRPRRMPDAKLIPKLFGKTAHGDLDYKWRNILNLSINHRIQSTGASIMNRAAIAFYQSCKELAVSHDAAWGEVKVVLQVHDELIAECPIHLAELVVLVLKDAMECTTVLPGVDLVAEPRIAYNLADLK